MSHMHLSRAEILANRRLTLKCWLLLVLPASEIAAVLESASPPTVGELIARCRKRAAKIAAAGTCSHCGEALPPPIDPTTTTTTTEDPPMNAISRVLWQAKVRRAAATTALQVAAVSAAADLLDAQACEAQVRTLEGARAAAIASAKPAAAMKIDAALIAARITLEIAEAKSATSTATHAAAVAAVSAAKAVVAEAARKVIDCELIALADQVTASLDAALSLGAQLQSFSARDFLRTPLNAPLPSVPVEVTRVLERLPPQRNPLDIPVCELRGHGAQGDGWQKRFAELIADDAPNSIDVDVAA
jgi:hypothetical protein